MKNIPIIAAVMCRTNIGLDLPDKEDVQNAIINNYSLEHAVVEFCQQFCEREYDLDRFTEEARSWERNLSAPGVTLDHWPAIKELFDA